MIAHRFFALKVTLVVGGFGTVYAQGEEAPAQPIPVEVFPLPGNTVFQRHVVGGDGTSVATGERLIYSNTQGAYAARLGANRLVSDDIATTAPNNCKLRRFEFPVVGKVDPAGIGGPYTVDFAIYSTCPNSVPSTSRPALIVLDTVGQAVFPDDAPRLISFVPAVDALLPTNLWLAVRFSRHNAGPIVGAPALVGFSADSFDWPGFACDSNLGGFPDQPHASFNLEIYGDSDCPEAFVGYKNSKPSGSVYKPGAGIGVADDIELGVNECQMSAYEVALKGVGFYEFEMRSDCDSAPIIGTGKTFIIGAGTDSKVARFNFDPPIPLPPDLWFAARINNNAAGMVITGKQAAIGRTEGFIGIEEVYGGCAIDNPFPTAHAAFDLTITCAGSPPVGACCDMYITDENGDAVCRELPRMNCPWPSPNWNYSQPQPQWMEGASCDPDPFPHPCGVAACCRPDQVCENLTRNECYAVPPLDAPRQWQRGRYCGVNGQQCPWLACFPRSGDCLTAREEPGCENAECCGDVCDADSYCCLVEWDRACVDWGNKLCAFIGEHDECQHEHTTQSALLVEADSATYFANTYATESEVDPDFCCRGDAPGDPGFGTVWFKFTATDTSARVSTCASDPTRDSLINVFAVGDPTTEETACATLSMIACSDDVADCGGGTHGEICVQGLVPGHTYYVMVASKTPGQRGIHQLDIRSPCFEEPIWNPEDCDGDGVQDGCKIGSDVGTDCNNTGTLDECEITDGTSFDCNRDLFPDECISVLNTLRPSTPYYSSFGRALAIEGEWLVVGEPEEPREWDQPPAPGVAYLFRRTGLTSWKQIAKLSSPDPGMSHFGESVALTNGRALITARQINPPSVGVSGAVYEFACGNEECHYEGKLEISDVAEFRRAVCRISASGNRVAVSACPTEAAVAAVIYVFGRKGSDWVEEGKIVAPSGYQYYPSFGRAISLDHEWLAVGAGFESHSDAMYLGATYLYGYNGVGWVFYQRLTSPAQYDDHYFGAAIDLRNDRLVVAAVSPSGFLEGPKRTAYVFRRVVDVWIPDGSETVFSGVGYIDEGSVHFINDGALVMGVLGGADRFTFAEVVHRLENGEWRAVESLPAPPNLASALETVIDTSGHLIAVGAWAYQEPPISSVHIYQAPVSDCNENGAGDGCDLRDATSPDCNGNDVPDECDALPPFDFDFEGDVDLIDFAAFQRCFTGPGSAKLASCCKVFDSEPDSDIDGADFVAFGMMFTGP